MGGKDDTEPSRITSIGDLVQEVRAAKDLLVRNGLDQAQADKIRFWFRGQAKAEWELKPKGLRLQSCDPMQTMRNMLHEFRAEAPTLADAPPEHHDLRQWLFLMQHHGMPTLLLDWTRSAFTALAFAVELDKEARDYDENDAALWRLRPGKWNKLSTARDTCALAEAYSPSLTGLFDAHFRREAGNKLPCLKAKSVTAIEPVFNSRRMIAQQGVFTIHGPKSEAMDKGDHDVGKTCLWKFNIPNCRKGALRQELHDLGILLSSIFPDLDHLSACIRRRYPTGASVAKEDPTQREGQSSEQSEPQSLGNGRSVVSDVESP